jgi:hypothetical protein
VKTHLISKVDEILMREMERIMSTEITPVNIFGDREGKPTTIRATLAERAKVFWEEKVNGEGRRESYGGSPRYEWLFNRVIKDEFEKVVKQNIVNMVGAFKDALKADAATVTAKHIDDLIKVKGALG